MPVTGNNIEMFTISDKEQLCVLMKPKNYVNHQVKGRSATAREKYLLRGYMFFVVKISKYIFISLKKCYPSNIVWVFLNSPDCPYLQFCIPSLFSSLSKDKRKSSRVLAWEYKLKLFIIFSYQFVGFFSGKIQLYKERNPKL